MVFFYLSNEGIKDDELLTDPQLGSKREELIKSKATELAEARMIIFDQVNGTFAITDLGGIAAKYYLRSKTVLIFNEFLRNGMDEADLLHVLCKSTEVRHVSQAPLRSSDRAYVFFI